MENKFGKYLRYAVGEILLVVIGILIALQINNWNINRKTEITVQNTLQELKQEFKANYQLLDSHEKKMTEGNHYLIKVLNFSAGKNEGLSIESLREYTSKMFSVDSIEISTSSLDGVITTGNISLLDSDLVSSLTVFVAGYDKFTSVDEIHGQNIFDDKSNELLMNLSYYKSYRELLYPDNPIEPHPEFRKNDEEFVSYIKKAETYSTINHLFSTEMARKVWVSYLKQLSKNIIDEIDKIQSNDL